MFLNIFSQWAIHKIRRNILGGMEVSNFKILEGRGGDQKWPKKFQRLLWMISRDIFNQVLTFFYLPMTANLQNIPIHYYMLLKS